MAGKVGIKDVARLAGVSAGTVTKVLKNYPGISERTRQKVLAVVEETGYIPNTVASALSTKQNNRIGLYIYINDQYQQIDEINMLYILGAFDRARKENLELVTVFHGSIENLSNEDTVRYFRSIHAEILIVFGMNKNNEKIHYLMREGHMKMVIIDAELKDDHVSTVMIDHRKAQYEIADRICGPKEKVLYLCGKEDGYVSDMRLEGMRKLAEDKQLDLTVINGEFSESKAYEIVKGLTEVYDVIVCANDLMAIGAKRALGENTSVKLAGFDGIRLMEYVADDVLTCRQDFYEIGGAAVEAAVHLRQGQKGEKVLLPYEITYIHR